MQLPSKRDYPDYYHVITNPIDLSMIEAKLRADKVNSESKLGANKKNSESKLRADKVNSESKLGTDNVSS